MRVVSCINTTFTSSTLCVIPEITTFIDRPYSLTSVWPLLGAFLLHVMANWTCYFQAVTVVSRCWQWEALHSSWWHFDDGRPKSERARIVCTTRPLSLRGGDCWLAKHWIEVKGKRKIKKTVWPHGSETDIPAWLTYTWYKQARRHLHCHSAAFRCLRLRTEVPVCSFQRKPDMFCKWSRQREVCH